MPDNLDRGPDTWSGKQVAALCAAIALVTSAWGFAGLVAAAHDAWPGFAMALAAAATLTLAAVVVQRQVLRRLDRNARQLAEIRSVGVALGTDTLARLEALASLVRPPADRPRLDMPTPVLTQSARNGRGFPPPPRPGVPSLEGYLEDATQIFDLGVQIGEERGRNGDGSAPATP